MATWSNQDQMSVFENSDLFLLLIWDSCSVIKLNVYVSLVIVSSYLVKPDH